MREILNDMLVFRMAESYTGFNDEQLYRKMEEDFKDCGRDKIGTLLLERLKLDNKIKNKDFFNSEAAAQKEGFYWNEKLDKWLWLPK